MAPPFENLRREHAQAIEALARLEAAVGGRCSEAGGGGSLTPAVAEFLRFCETTLEPHLTLEEVEVYPLLDRYLPPEVGSANVLLREHETFRGLLAELRSGRQRLADGAPDAESDVVVLVEDVALLLRDHIRKEDGVIHPLLEGLLKATQ